LEAPIISQGAKILFLAIETKLMETQIPNLHKLQKLLSKRQINQVNLVQKKLLDK
jgi:hypothetical protein